MTGDAVSSGRRTASIVLALAAMAFGIALGLAGTFIIPSFKSVFASFGADLPVATKLLINFRYFLWTPLLLVPVLWLPLWTSMARIYCYSIILACEVISIPLIIIIMYLPIFKLGQAI